MKNILVTGADGYIGTHVIDLLKKDPAFFITAAVLDAGKYASSENVRYINFDLKKDSRRENLFEETGKPDVCLHLAWRDGFVHNSLSHLEDYYDHFSFIRNLIDHGTSQVAVAGSFREYGNAIGMTNVDSFVQPGSFYSLSKMMLKRSLEIYFENKDVCFQWFRPFTVYGDEERNHSILSKILQWDKEGKKTFPFTDGNEQYDYIEVNELARQIVAIVSQKEIDGVIDCCTGHPTRMGDIVEQFIKDNGLSIRPEYGAFPPRKYDTSVIFGDNRKILRIMECYENTHRHVK